MYQFKQELAMAYFPDCEETPVEFRQRKRRIKKKTASRLFARELNLTPGLLDALRTTGYRPAQKRLSPRQFQVLITYLGEP